MHCWSNLKAILKKQIDVVYNNIKLVVDNKSISFGQDSAGKQIEPFIYNGTTYLPVRTVGEALNKRVDWDSKNNTVYIGKRNSSDPDKFLNDMDYFSQGSSAILSGIGGTWEESNYKESEINIVDNSFTDNANNVYNKGFTFNLKSKKGPRPVGFTMYNEYLLNQEYSKFRGTFALSYENRSDDLANAVLSIYGDDKLIYKSKEMTKGVLPIDLDIDVSNIIKLKFEIINDNASESLPYEDIITFGIMNPELYQ